MLSRSPVPKRELMAAALALVVLGLALLAPGLATPDRLREAEVIFSGWGAPVMDEAFLSAAPNLPRRL